MTTGIDYYERLHVSPLADQDVIKAAYRVLMQKHHPDHNGTTGAAMRLNEAYANLSDPTLRQHYDEERKKLKGRKVGSFIITDVIAEGGFGVTYKGKHHLTGLPVCVKQSHETSPELNQVIINETSAIWDLRHHGLPVMRDLLEMDDGSLLLVMSFVEGMNLAELMEKVQRRLEPRHVAWVVERILNVLRFLHRHKVVHGDIKPQNIMIQPVGHTVTLVDFGLAMINPSRHSKPLGYTEVFAPPEQLSGMPLLPESDLYSLGVVMLFLLTGGDLTKVKGRNVPNDLPRPFRHFLADLLRIDPLTRPPWQTAFATWEQVREESGLPHTKNEPIPGL